MITSHRIALAASALLIGLTACGDASTPAADATVPVIKIGGSPSGATTAGGFEDAPTDRMSMPMMNITYVYNGQYPVLSDSGVSWQFAAGYTPSVEQMRQIAAALGIAGDPVQLPADQGGGWLVGPSDWSGPTVTFSADGMGSWWYNMGPSVGQGWACPAVEPGVVDPIEAPDETSSAEEPADTTPSKPVDGGAGIAECVAPPAPVGIPTAEEARQLALDLFAALGIDPAALDVEVYADEWSASVNAFLLLDGVRSPISMSVGFGENASLAWASGYLASPTRVGDYPLVGCEAGLARLNDEANRWMYGWGNPMFRGDVVVGNEGGAGGATEAAPPALPPDTLPADQPIEPLPIDELPVEELPVEEMVIELSSCTIGSTMVWTEDGGVWIVPAYLFGSADGGQYSVIAIDDSFLELPEPIQIDPLPAPDGTLPDTTLPVDDGATDPPTDIGEPVDQQAAAGALVGLTMVEAEEIAKVNGWSLRVVAEDGELFAVTEDYSPTRVNLVITDGLITAVDSIG